MDMQTWRDSRKQADQATYALREALAALGVPERIQRHLRPVVTHHGRPLVHVGLLRAEHAAQIAEVLRVRTDSQQAGP
ncbi:hypothetical protein [Streptomyces sp. NPDC005760]|uniref:hypothetical protein n=1 Tax=Streptomyces sp. NPDC005760 TaxID=3156718 RepID=UPI003407B3BE